MGLSVDWRCGIQGTPWPLPGFPLEAPLPQCPKAHCRGAMHVCAVLPVVGRFLHDLCFLLGPWVQAGDMAEKCFPTESQGTRVMRKLGQPSLRHPVSTAGVAAHGVSEGCISSSCGMRHWALPSTWPSYWTWQRGREPHS